MSREPQPRAGVPTLSYDDLPDDQAPDVPPRLDSVEWSPPEPSDETPDRDEGEGEEH